MRTRHGHAGVRPHEAGRYAKLRTRSVMLVALIALGTGYGHAQPFPAKPIRISVPNQAGGTSDIVARIIGQQMTEQFKQQVIVEARLGAGGNINAEYVAQAPADGYVLGHFASTTLTANPSLYPKLKFNPVKDFTPVAMLVLLPSMLVVHPSLPPRNLREFIAFVKARPGELSYASSGSGQTAHLGMELLKATAGLNILHVPYKAVVPATLDVIGGRVSMMMSSVASGMPHVKTGRLRVIAVASAKRLSSAPDLPTIAESGFPGFDISLWHGLFAPAGTPADVVARLAGSVAQALDNPEVRKQLVNAEAEPAVGVTAEKMMEQVRLDTVKWQKVIRASGAKVE
jgi:tripartite-type tricarboxylate transporter receptor subunit TctC